MAKKIAILHYAAPPTVGGVESTIYHHSRHLSSKGINVTVIAGRGSEFLPQVRLRVIPELDSRHPGVLEIGKSLALGLVNGDFEELKLRIFELLEPILIEFDVCIVHNVLTLHKNLPLTAALCQLVENQGARLIAWCHDFAWLDPLYKPQLYAGYPWELLKKKWSGVQYVTVSEHRRNQLANLFGIDPHEIAVVSPGVELSELLKLEPLTLNIIDRLNLLASDPLLLLPARITRRKNIEFAIHVLAEISQIRPRATLLITGPPGPHNPTNLAYLESLLKLKSDLGVAEKVHFLFESGDHGKPLHIPDRVMADLFQVADILIFPSRREGFGIPIIEAGISRIAVFAADIPPIRESSQGHAYLFNLSEDPAQVSRAILDHIQSDYAYQLRKVALMKYSWESIIENEVMPLIGMAGMKNGGIPNDY
jgi:glycosyltransferase involved in cell wall biosynthesis